MQNMNALQGFKNLDKMTSGETFKAQRRKSLVHTNAPMYQAFPGQHLDSKAGSIAQVSETGL